MPLCHVLIDIHEAMGGHPEWFPDTVHPNSAGTSVLAAHIGSHLFGPADPPPELPELQVTGATGTRLHLAWTPSGFSFVAESAPALKLTNTVWTVVDRPIVNRGDSLVLTNLAPGAMRYYRLKRF